MLTTEIALHADLDRGPGPVGVVARYDRTIGELPIVRLYIGGSLVLTMSEAMAERITDALVDAEVDAADPPVVSRG
jgi:hypothetical protein